MIRNGKKKAISCALVAAMSVGLAACGTTSYDFKVSGGCFIESIGS